jgi:aminoglycoside phosphotransferase (APT) family kinase protein
VPLFSQGQSRAGLLTATLAGCYGQLGITGLREIGAGLDARVYRADSAELGFVAIRVPHTRLMSSGNETLLDTRLLLRQECELSGHLRAHGLPVPAMFVLHTDDAGIDFTIAEYVESDGGELAADEFGRLIRAVHEVPVPPLDLVCMESRDDADLVLAERIGDRLRKLAAVTGLELAVPDVGGALAADRASLLPRRLLHMDLRPENVLVRSGRPAALLDWSNALAGDPALDLARTAEYGSLTPEVLAAYGDAGPFGLTPASPRQVVYRLDTAVMLSHVFLDGAPDQARARHYIDQTRSLCGRLAGN